jgi:tripartite-type tricarboxylate transporter receptor subunit TctC
MKKMMTVLSVVSFALVMTLGPRAFAESKFPSKPIDLYVGFSAGGSTDTIARALAVGAEKFLGKKVLVVNKPGAGGAVAAALIAKSKPDGYTIQISPDTPLTRTPHLRNIEFDPLKDFVFISQVGVWINGFVVGEDSPFKTWQDVVKWAKEHPGELKYGNPGSGTTPDITMAVIAHRQGFTYRSSPFQGDTPNMAALLGGHTMVAGSSSGAWSKYVKAKQMRLLAVFEKEGMKSFPNAPTFKELGYDIQTPTSVVIFGPKGISGETVKKLSEAFAAGAKTEAFKSVADAMELMETDKPLVGKDLDKSIRQAYQVYKGYIEEAGLAKK